MYTLEKKGAFHLKFAKGNKCGGFPGASDFSYTFTVKVTELDDEGFVIEHVRASEAISKWSEKKAFSGSCEQVVDAVWAIILKHLKTSGTVKLEVTRNGNATVGRSGFVSL